MQSTMDHINHLVSRPHQCIYMCVLTNTPNSIAGNVTSLPIKVAGTMSPCNSREMSIHARDAIYVNKGCLTIASSRNCNQHKPKGCRDAVK